MTRHTLGLLLFATLLATTACNKDKLRYGSSVDGGTSPSQPDIDEPIVDAEPMDAEPMDATPDTETPDPVQPDVLTQDAVTDTEPDAEMPDPALICASWGNTVANCLIDDCPVLQTLAMELAGVTASICREQEADIPGASLRYLSPNPISCDDNDSDIGRTLASTLEIWRNARPVEVLCRTGEPLNPRETCEAACNALLSPCGAEFPPRELPTPFESELRLAHFCHLECAINSRFADMLNCMADQPEDTSCNDGVIDCLQKRTLQVPPLRVHMGRFLYGNLPNRTWLLVSRESNPLAIETEELNQMRLRVFNAQDQMLFEETRRRDGSTGASFYTTLPLRVFDDFYFDISEEAFPTPPMTAELVLIWRQGGVLREDPPVRVPIETPEPMASGHLCWRYGIVSTCEAPLICDRGLGRCLPDGQD